VFSGLENPIHLLLLLLLLLVLFGARRLPEMGRSLGTGMREFKDSITGRAATGPAAAAPRPELVAGGDRPDGGPAGRAT
jgi:sec-independent protein translocase protein TatA